MWHSDSRNNDANLTGSALLLPRQVGVTSSPSADGRKQIMAICFPPYFSSCPVEL